MATAKTLFKLCAAHRTRAIGIIFHLSGLEYLPKSDTHSLGNGCDIADNRHDCIIRPKQRNIIILVC